MPNETTAVTTGAEQRAVAAHQPGQGVFKSVLSEDINWKPFAHHYREQLRRHQLLGCRTHSC